MWRFPLSVTSYDMHVHPTAASAYSPSEIPVSIHHYPKAQYIGSCPAQVLYWHATFHVHQAFHGYHHIIIQPCHTSVQPSYAVARQAPYRAGIVSSQESRLITHHPCPGCCTTPTSWTGLCPSRCTFKLCLLTELQAYLFQISQ